jgi:hypothetical protein
MELIERIALFMHNCIRMSANPGSATDEERAVLAKFCSTDEPETLLLLFIERALAVVGTMAVCLSAYLEVDVMAEMKRREMLVEAKKNANKKTAKGKSNASVASSKRRSRASTVLPLSTSMNRSRGRTSFYQYDDEVSIVFHSILGVWIRVFVGIFWNWGSRKLFTKTKVFKGKNEVIYKSNEFICNS